MKDSVLSWKFKFGLSSVLMYLQDCTKRRPLRLSKICANFICSWLARKTDHGRKKLKHCFDFFFNPNQFSPSKTKQILDGNGPFLTFFLEMTISKYVLGYFRILNNYKTGEKSKKKINIERKLVINTTILGCQINE